MDDITIKETTFEKVLPIWRECLWPGRKSEVRSKSSLCFGGGYDMSIYDMPESQFWCAIHKNKILGVNSGFWTGSKEYRSRGLYVAPEYRGAGVGKKLLELAINFAKQEDAKRIWSLPRKQSLSVYEGVGFVTVGSWIEDSVEFGPNIYAAINF